MSSLCMPRSLHLTDNLQHLMMSNWFCLFVDLWVLPFPLEDCSVFGNFVITLIWSSTKWTSSSSHELVRDSSAVRRLFFFARAVGRQRALHKENSGFASPTLGRHISTFCGYRIWFSNLTNLARPPQNQIICLYIIMR